MGCKGMYHVHQLHRSCNLSKGTVSAPTLVKLVNVAPDASCLSEVLLGTRSFNRPDVAAEGAHQVCLF
jgi:hypothetical protein